MAEPHVEAVDASKYIRHQEDVPANAISPTDTVAAALKQLTVLRKHRFLLFRIEGAQVVVDASAPRSASFADFERALPASDCRYAVYNHEFTSADPKLFFVTWIPQSARPGVKMAYAQAKPAVRAVCDGAVDVDAACKQQVAQGVGASDGDGDDPVVELSSPVCFMSFMAF